MPTPFEPTTGMFADNIRSTSDDDETELRESMQGFGWITEFPALVDEFGVTLVGHRRMKIATDLKIAPVIKVLKLGAGAKADAERMKLAIASNIGFKPMTADDRRRIAEYLYGHREWTMVRIAVALNVSQKTISKDLDGVYTQGINLARPKGGRPKNNGKVQAKAPKRHYKETEIVSLSDRAKTMADVAATTGVGKRQVRHVIERERARREVEPTIDPATLDVAAKDKLAIAYRQQRRRQEGEFAKIVQAAEQRIRDEWSERFNEHILPHYKKELANADAVVKSRKGIMDRKTFNKIWSCLHTDSRNSVSDQKLNDALNIFSNLELILVKETELATQSVAAERLPGSAAAWQAMKRNKKPKLNKYFS